MTKYKKKEEVIEVEPYKLGIEDGFMKFNEYIDTASHNYPRDMISTKYPRYLATYDYILNEIIDDPDTDWQPYIDNNKGEHIRFSNTDMVVMINNYKSHSISKEKLEEDYIPLDFSETDTLRKEIYELKQENNSLLYTCKKEHTVNRRLRDIAFIIDIIKERYPEEADSIIQDAKDLTIKKNTELIDSINTKNK